MLGFIKSIPVGEESNMGRPTGQTRQTNAIDMLMTSIFTRGQHIQVSEEIVGQTGCTIEHAALPSAHLRWGLRQIKLRGWSNTDWGALFDGNQLGDGPICILESVRAPSDAPSQLHYELSEQKYLRLALRVLGVEPIPVYVSEWNDSQAEVDAIETVLEKAIELAEADEAEGNIGGRWPTSQTSLMELFGITREALRSASERLDAELTQDGAASKTASTPVIGGDDAGSGPATVHGDQGPSATFDAPHDSATNPVAE